ncbi:MAG: type III secretion system export apparatus subunit SctT [Chlamydiota bacterium]
MDIVSSTDNYLSLYLSLPNISPITSISFFFLSLARILPIIFLAPFFGGKLVPPVVKIGFGISLAAIFLPQMLVSAKGNLILGPVFMILMLKEIFIGFILGFLASIPFYFVQSTGSLIDHQRGASSLQVTDPSTQVQTSPIGVVYNYILITIFFAIGGPIFLIDALGKSFQLVPADAFLNPIFFSAKIPLWHLLFGLLDHLLKMTIQLGAPALIGMLITDMFLGIANRLAPQVQIVFLGMPLKSWVGLALLAAAWYFILQQMGKESTTWLNVIEQTIKGMGKLTTH